MVDPLGALVTRYVLPPTPGATAGVVCPQQGTLVEGVNGLACEGSCNVQYTVGLVVVLANDVTPAVGDVCFSRCTVLPE